MDGLRISQLAHRAGVSTSTVRYYERIGLVSAPDRTSSGYRVYDSAAEARLLFITRGKRLGLSLDEIAELMAIWDGSNCGATQDRVVALLDDKRAEIADQIRELRSFEEQLATTQASIAAAPTPDSCDADLGCCVPELSDFDVSLRVGVREHSLEGEVVTEPIPIACTLTASERPERADAFSALFADVVSWDRTRQRLQLRFAHTTDIEQQVERLTAQESACCAFLTFETRRDRDELIWKITAPSAEASVVIDAFAALLPSDRQASSR